MRRTERDLLADEKRGRIGIGVNLGRGLIRSRATTGREVMDGLVTDEGNSSPQCGPKL